MNVVIEKSWKNEIGEYFNTDSFRSLSDFVRNEYLNTIVYPKPKDLFNAFFYTPFDNVKVVVLGQDPYHSPGQAHGLCFSVPRGVPLPPSLRNIYKEIESDIKIKKDYTNGDLSDWANQGVFLLNSVLTVRKGSPGSHAGKGWEEFTDFVVRRLSESKEKLVFLLWGSYARKKGSVIDRNKHLVLEATHPSPLSAYNGFFGCEHFSKTNEYLIKNNLDSISW